MTTSVNAYNPRTELSLIGNTTLQPRLVPPSHSLAQRLSTAKEEWNNLFSKRRTDPDPCKAFTHTLQTTRTAHTQPPATLYPRPPGMTAENHRTNTSWGDPLVEKPMNVTRLYSLNFYGLSLDRRKGKFDELCQITKDVQADIACCQEHNLDTTRTSVRIILHETTRQHWPRSRITYGNAPTPFLTDYKPGGTMITTVGDITGRIVSQSKDRCGRWTSQIIKGTGSIYVTEISAYQVVTDIPNTGLTTAASQQISLLFQTGDSEKRPRKAFKRDLSTFLKRHNF